MRHDAFSNDNGPTTLMASAWHTLCGLTVRPLRTATHPWFWLARSGALESTAPVLLVLFDGLSGLVGGSGTGVCGHG